MPFLIRIFAGLALWLIGEFVAFTLIAQAIGLDAAIVLTILTSLAGALLLHRLGASARQSLMAALNGGDLSRFAPERLSAGFAAGLGALLLLLPGFLTDAVGLVLIAQSLRGGRFFGFFDKAPRRNSERIIELSPEDWRHIEPGERR